MHLRAAIERARSLTDGLFAKLPDALLFERPIAERHRLIFYVGHLEAFDWNQASARLSAGEVDPGLDRLFAFGIDPPLGQEPVDRPSDWPTPEMARTYVAKARRKVDAVLRDLSGEAVHMMIEHRLMHFETLTYLLHNLDRQFAPDELSEPGAAESPAIEVAAGEAVLGQDAACFGWDNEFARHAVHVPGFSISARPVTGAEYAKFVEQGGSASHYALRPDRAVYVTQRQAASYAAWVGKTLPTEAQLHRAPLKTAEGWEWTGTPFAPFEGFEASPFYPGYSADFFDGEHFVLKGASPATDPILRRPSFRNWFRADYPYAYTAFRLVEN